MKLSIADLSEQCFPEDVMIGREDAALTERVKARVFAEIGVAEQTAKVVPIRSKRIVTLAFVAALILSLGAVAYAICSIHAAKQQELRSELHMDEHHTDSYVEFTVPEDATPGITLLSTINDGEIQKIYVNVSPVTEEDIAGYPEQPVSFLWQIVNSDLTGYASPWIKPGTSAHTPEEIQALIRRDAYDSETQTLTLCCLIFSEQLEAYLGSSGSDSAELELFLAEDYIATRSFGRITLTSTAEERCCFDFGNVTWVDSESGKEVEFVGLELTPLSGVWRLRYSEAEAVYTGSDLELQQAWLLVEDSVCMNARIVFSDGSSMVTKGALSSNYEDGVVSLYTSWPRAIDIHDVQQIVLDDLILWENK